MRVYHEFELSGTDAGDEHLNKLLEKTKQLVISKLQHLEKEMQVEEGVIIIVQSKDSKRIDINNFSPALNKKITEILRDIDFNQLNSK